MKWISVIAIAVALTSCWCSSGKAEVSHEMVRDGFHFQIAFGWGIGPDSNGLAHNMEIGGNFSNGWTLAYNHVFIQNKGFARPDGGPDLVGGHLLILKIPWFDAWVAKVGAGPGGIHDQSDGIKAELGLGLTYGLDYHIVVTPGSGMTLGMTGIHAFLDAGRHFFGASATIGYTWF